MEPMGTAMVYKVQFLASAIGSFRVPQCVGLLDTVPAAYCRSLNNCQYYLGVAFSRSSYSITYPRALF